MRKPISLLLAFIQLLIIGIVSAQATDAKKDKLISLADSTTGVITLNSNTYDRFTEGKRSYGIVVLLTALDSQFNCVPCR
jgi:oligosaccharyltransferase complex subunit gamma